MNKRGFLDIEVLASPGFIILVVMAVAATIIGWKMSSSWGEGSWPLWQIILIIVAEVIASYVIVARASG